MVAAVLGPLGEEGTLYRTYDVAKVSGRWEIDMFYNGDSELTDRQIDRLVLRRIDHADPVVVIITDPTITGGDMQYTGLSLAEVRAGVLYAVEPNPGELSGYPNVYVVGDILGNVTDPNRGSVVSEVYESDGATWYRVYFDAVRSGDRWILNDFYNNDMAFTASLLDQNDLRRVAHADPHTVIINDSMTSTGEIGWYRLSLAEFLAGKSYDHMGTWHFNTGDILGNDTAPTRYIVANATTSDSGPSHYTLHEVVRGADSWEIPTWVNGRIPFEVPLGAQLGDLAFDLVDHTDPHFAIVTDAAVENGLTWEPLSLGEILEGLNGYPPERSGPTPFKPMTIPGRIEAEDYDLGGEGVAYHDTTPGNLGGVYRQDDVDIETTAGEGTPNVGWIRTGEYLTYTASIATSGTYTMTARVASPNSGRTAALQVDGTQAATISVPNTGSFAAFRTVSVPVILPAGTHTLKLVFSGDGQNINWISFATGGVTTPTPTPTPTPGAGGASFVTVPTTAPHGSPFKFTVTPAAGKSISAAWWSFDAPAHLNTWNSRTVNPTFYYFVPGTYSPLVRLTYTDGTADEVHRVSYVRST